MRFAFSMRPTSPACVLLLLSVPLSNPLYDVFASSLSSSSVPVANLSPFQSPPIPAAARIDAAFFPITDFALFGSPPPPSSSSPSSSSAASTSATSALLPAPPSAFVGVSQELRDSTRSGSVYLAYRRSVSVHDQLPITSVYISSSKKSTTDKEGCGNVDLNSQVRRPNPEEGKKLDITWEEFLTKYKPDQPKYLCWKRGEDGGNPGTVQKIWTHVDIMIKYSDGTQTRPSAIPEGVDYTMQTLFTLPSNPISPVSRTIILCYTLSVLTTRSDSSPVFSSPSSPPHSFGYRSGHSLSTFIALAKDSQDVGAYVRGIIMVGGKRWMKGTASVGDGMTRGKDEFGMGSDGEEERWRYVYLNDVQVLLPHQINTNTQKENTGQAPGEGLRFFTSPSDYNWASVHVTGDSFPPLEGHTLSPVAMQIIRPSSIQAALGGLSVSPSQVVTHWLVLGGKSFGLGASRWNDAGWLLSLQELRGDGNVDFEWSRVEKSGGPGVKRTHHAAESIGSGLVVMFGGFGRIEGSPAVSNSKLSWKPGTPYQLQYLNDVEVVRVTIPSLPSSMPVPATQPTPAPPPTTKPESKSKLQPNSPADPNAQWFGIPPSTFARLQHWSTAVSSSRSLSSLFVKPLGSSPSPRAHASSALLSIDGKVSIAVFGGINTAGAVGKEMWVLKTPCAAGCGGSTTQCALTSDGWMWMEVEWVNPKFLYALQHPMLLDLSSQRRPQPDVAGIASNLPHHHFSFSSPLSYSSPFPSRNTLSPSSHVFRSTSFATASLSSSHAGVASSLLAAGVAATVDSPEFPFSSVTLTASSPSGSFVNRFFVFGGYDSYGFIRNLNTVHQISCDSQSLGSTSLRVVQCHAVVSKASSTSHFPRHDFSAVLLNPISSLYTTVQQRQQHDDVHLLVVGGETNSRRVGDHEYWMLPMAASGYTVEKWSVQMLGLSMQEKTEAESLYQEWTVSQDESKVGVCQAL